MAKDTSLPLTLEVGGRLPFGGLNLAVSRMAIGDNQFVDLKGCLSMTGSLRAFPAPVTIYTGGALGYWAAVSHRGGTAYIELFMSDGSVLELNVTSATEVATAAVTVAAAGTFSPANVLVGGKGVYPQCVDWKNTMTLFIDPALGYFSWDGTTLTAIAATTLGHAIEVYRERVWIINNRTLTFTAPGSYSDFSVSDSAGATGIPDSTLYGPIVGIKGVGHYLFFMGENWIGAISYIQVQNGIPIFALQGFASGVGPYLPDGFDVISGSLFISGADRAWPLNGPSPPILTRNLGSAYGPGTVAHGVLYGEEMVFFLNVNNGRLFVLTAGRWAEYIAPTGTFRIVTAYINGSPHVLAIGNTATTIFVADLTPLAPTYQALTITSKLFDFDDPLYDKTGIQAGVFTSNVSSLTLGLQNESLASESYALTPTTGNTFTWHGYSTIGKHMSYQITIPAGTLAAEITGVIIDAQPGPPW